MIKILTAIALSITPQFAVAYYDIILTGGYNLTWTIGSGISHGPRFGVGIVKEYAFDEFNFAQLTCGLNSRVIDQKKEQSIFLGIDAGRINKKGIILGSSARLNYKGYQIIKKSMIHTRFIPRIGMFAGAGPALLGFGVSYDVASQSRFAADLSGSLGLSLPLKMMWDNIKEDNH